MVDALAFSTKLDGQLLLAVVFAVLLMLLVVLIAAETPKTDSHVGTTSCNIAYGQRSMQLSAHPFVDDF